MAEMKTLPRSIRNNNPLNIDHNPANRWVGILPRDKRNAAQLAEPRFEVFSSPVYGFRAAAILLQNYQEKYGLKTIRQLVNRWAPPVENDTGAYVTAVARAVGVPADAPVDIHEYRVIRPMIEAMAQHETGRDPRTGKVWQFNSAEIDEGLRRAGITPAVAPKVPVETVAPAAAATLGVADLTEVLPQVADAMTGAESHISSGSAIRVIFGVLTVVIAGYVAYSQIKAQRLKSQ